MKITVVDVKEKFKATIDEVSGFLTAPVVLARVGVQHYYGYELGLTGDESTKKFGVYRSPEEVFSKNSVDTFINLVATDDHPLIPVTVDNVKDLQVGTVSGVKASDNKETLEGLLTITDKESIKKSKDGKVEVSVGYSNTLIEKKGTYNGVDYDFAQTEIEANHLAIVDAGRCGAACKITIDKKKESPVKKVTIDGIDYEVENDQLAQAIQNQQVAHDAEVGKLEKEKEKMDEEKEEMKKAKEKAEGEKAAMKKDALTGDALSSLVNDRAILIVDARSILGDKMPKCTDCPQEIKMAVIDHVYPDMDLADKGDEYVTGIYDMAIAKSKTTKTNFENLQKDFLKDDDGKEITRDSARDGYLKTIEGDK